VTQPPQAHLEVPHTQNFAVNGLGDHRAWEKAAATPMNCRRQLKDHAQYATWFKTLWSATGIYFLIDCADPLITSTGLADFGPIWEEDVAEVFLWPDESLPIYFEYCISPLGAEIPLICPDIDGHHVPWTAWNYNERRRVQKAVTVRGGEQKPGAAIGGWTVEMFIPFRLLKPLRNARPEVGMTWRANVYRIDYDGDKTRYFAWQDVGQSFHNFQAFPTMRFV
jgi:hypothetical protein